MKDDIKLLGVREEDTEDRARRKQMIGCGEPLKGMPERKRGRLVTDDDNSGTCSAASPLASA